MPKSYFDATASSIIDSVRAGATFDEACRCFDVNVNTARSWLAQGRRDVQGRYGEFAARVDAVRSERRTAEGALRDGPVTLVEAEAVLAAAVRKGSIPALKLWFDRHGDAGGGDDDPFGEFDAAR